MNRNIWQLLLGVGMVVVGLTLYGAYRGTETPVVGLRQTGAVLAVVGVVELVAVGWNAARAGRARD